MDQTWEDESHLINMGQNIRTSKYESQWAKWVTFVQMGQTWENKTHLINMGHTYKNCRTWKKDSHWAKWVKLGKITHTL